MQGSACGTTLQHTVPAACQLCMSKPSYRNPLQAHVHLHLHLLLTNPLLLQVSFMRPIKSAPQRLTTPRASFSAA